MNISKFQNIKISDISGEEKPTDIVSIDADGNLQKSPIGVTNYGRIIDGGSANTIYLSHQNVEGGSANSVTNYKINGGNA